MILRDFRLAPLSVGLTVTLIAAGLSGAAHAETYDRYSEWDGNRDGFLRKYEFSNYIYGMADEDNDGLLNNEEWALYTGSWYDPYHARYEEFSFYDTDSSGYLENGEFNESFYDAELFDTWDYDRNGFVDTNEWNDGINTHESFAASRADSNAGE